VIGSKNPDQNTLTEGVSLTFYHYLKSLSKGNLSLSALRAGLQAKAGAWVCQFQVMLTGSWDVEQHLFGLEGG